MVIKEILGLWATRLVKNLFSIFIGGGIVAIIREADFPAACRGILVGRFGNPRFPR